MALQILGADGTSIQSVDPTAKAARVSVRPIEVAGYNSVGTQTGLLTGLAANSAIFSLRNLSSNLLLIRRVGIGFVTITAFITAQRVDFGLTFARAFTASDSGGTVVPLTGNNGKHRTSLATPTSVDCRVSTTAALTAGTKTLDPLPLGQVVTWSGAIGASLSPAPDNLFSHNTGDYPLILAVNEGINIIMPTAMGAAGVGIAYMNIEFAEVVSY